MKLIEIFNHLTSGELSQIHIGGGHEGEINESNYKNIMSHINLGLTQLHRRFNIREGRLQLALQEGQGMYILHSRYAVNGKRTTEPVRYIIDTVSDPFLDNILKVERVFNTAYEFGLNDGSDEYACDTPGSNILRVPVKVLEKDPDLFNEIKKENLTVVYRANHKIIDPEVGSFDPRKLEIELPYTHLNALLYFVASRVHNPIGMVNELNMGNNYAAKYEQECQRLEIENFQTDNGQQNTKLQRGGWV